MVKHKRMLLFATTSSKKAALRIAKMISSKHFETKVKKTKRGYSVMQRRRK